MAIELDTRIWCENENKNNFLNILNAINNSGFCQGDWNNFSIYRRAPGSKIYYESGKIDLKNITEKILEFEDDTILKFTVYSSLNCWRFLGNKSSREYVPVAISSWGKNYGQQFGFSTDMEGDMQFSIISSGSYIEVLDDSSNEINEKVEINIENYLSIVQQIITDLSPLKLFSFDDSCHYLLHNVHMAYFSSLTVLKESLINYYQILLNGLKEYNIPPLKDIDDKNKSYLHEWRSDNQKKQLLQSLNEIISNDAIITEAKIQETIDSGKYDYFERDKSVLILEYPFFMNAFLDRFICDNFHPSNL